MYGIFTYIWVIYGVNVAKYSIHGSTGYSSQISSQGSVQQVEQGRKTALRPFSSNESNRARIGFANLQKSRSTHVPPCCTMLALAEAAESVLYCFMHDVSIFSANNSSAFW